MVTDPTCGHTEDHRCIELSGDRHAERHWCACGASREIDFAVSGASVPWIEIGYGTIPVEEA